MSFQLVSDYQPTGDQPQAIRQLVEGINRGDRAQTLLGVTGSGKTFTMANVIAQVQKPTLILSHNKTLVAQLYGEFTRFFPHNAVEYFVSYYDYYQPEAYVSVTDTYIEKDLAINEEIEKLRLRTTSALMSGRRDVIVVASVSCIYGMGNPEEYKKSIIHLQVGQTISRNQFLFKLVDILYSRTETDFQRGTFRVRGDLVEIYPPYSEVAFRITFFGDDIEEIESIQPENGRRIAPQQHVIIYPANLYLMPKEQYTTILREIEDELFAQEEYFKSVGKLMEAARIHERVTFDLEMIRELGYCSGIENYSRFFDRRKSGQRPFCLLDYFPDDYLMIIDESHVTMPQISGMYGGDRSRKLSLVEYGFRLPSAIDNRPLNFQEFQGLVNQVIYVSATPADFELEQSEGVVVEQIVRPTGLLDPPIEVRPSLNQIDDLTAEIYNRAEKGERILVTTLTKRMAEELTKYLTRLNIKCRYIHSEVDTLERVEIIRNLRLGDFDVLIGVNLLREGLDLPEVSLVAILDADKEGFLRNERSLIQTAGRAARNANGLVIMYADTITKSMQRTIDETHRKRSRQIAYNEAHGITPTTVFKTKEQILEQTSVLKIKQESKAYTEPEEKVSIAADPIVQYMSKPQLEKAIEQTRKKMQQAAKDQDFMEAARLRDEMFALQDLLKEKYG
ncbi:excinuclease ABC subunit UvrB [Sphingobacteriales bacterium UPWRP_1]|nr:excinuclease ABC subunit B [Sphingobacteriales bacterium TSM_CSM]PSJ76588.1 excinuclease ABC subunit UvrB [Sphingobacteriales bacterium UPWRP_1]